MRTHWAVRHKSVILKAAQTIIWACGGASGIWVAWKDRPGEIVLLCLVLGCAGASAFSFFALKIGDYVDERFGYRALGNEFAAKLEERLRVGDSAWTADQLATLWAGEGAAQLEWNLRFRWIKHAVINGHVEGKPYAGVNRATVISMRQLAAFFRRPNWHRLVEAPEGFYDGKVRKLEG